MVFATMVIARRCNHVGYTRLLRSVSLSSRYMTTS